MTHSNAAIQAPIETHTAENPLWERTVMVHKKDEEGVLFINAGTGRVQQPLDEQPDWAEGLAQAILGERLHYYSTRLGPLFTIEMKEPQAYAFEDLTWAVVNDEGDLFEQDADDEFRMEAIATVIGADREEGTIKGEGLTEVELSLDRTRTEGEVAALETAQEQGFEAIRKDGTHN